MGKRKRLLLWRRDKYTPPDIENSVQLLLQVIRTGIATYDRVTLVIWPESVKALYWTIETPDLVQAVRPLHMRLLVERNLVNLYNMSPEEFLAQHALGTLKGHIVIGITNNNQLGLDL